MKTTLLLMALLVVCTFTLLPSGAQAAPTTTYYTVYCANGKIEVDTRNLQQMLSARGSSVYSMQQFNNRSEADRFAKQFGGIGGKCPKK